MLLCAAVDSTIISIVRKCQLQGVCVGAVEWKQLHMLYMVTPGNDKSQLKTEKKNKKSKCI